MKSMYAMLIVSMIYISVGYGFHILCCVAFQKQVRKFLVCGGYSEKGEIFIKNIAKKQIYDKWICHTFLFPVYLLNLAKIFVAPFSQNAKNSGEKMKRVLEKWNKNF